MAASTQLLEARIHLFGLFGDEIALEPAQATVELDPSAAPKEWLAALIPSLAVVLVRNSRHAPDITQPLIELLELTSDALCEDEATARDCHLREWVNVDPVEILSTEGDERAAVALGMGLPSVTDEPTAKRDRTVVARLIERRDGSHMARVKGFWRGAGHITAWGLFALIEYAARFEPYDTVTLPAMQALSICLGALGGRVPSLAEVEELQGVIDRLTAGDSLASA